MEYNDYLDFLASLAMPWTSPNRNSLALAGIKWDSLQDKIKRDFTSVQVNGCYGRSQWLAIPMQSAGW